MVESDHDEEERKVVQNSADKISSDEISNKRIREETSDSEKNVQLKKARIKESSNDEEKLSSKSKKIVSSSHVNNDIKDVDSDQNKDINNQTKSLDIDDDNVNECLIADHIDAAKSTIIKGNKSEEINNDSAQENEKNSVKILEGEFEKHEEVKEKFAEVEPKKEINDQKKKKKKEESEIINGVELTVECASDEDSSEESEKEEIKKPRPKTEIIREQPNDSEVDASSSEAEKSDFYKIIEAKSKDDNETTPIKQAKKKGRRKSSLKVTLETDSNTEDEDYSPVMKKKIKKSLSAKKTTEVKKGRGRPRGRPPKSPVKSSKELVEDESEKKTETSSDETEKPKNKQSKEAKETDRADSKSEDSAGEESDEKSSRESDESEDVKKGKRRKPSKRNIKKIENLKKFIRAAGIRVKCYATLLKGCETDAAKAKRLTEFLHEYGVVGRPTLDKCNKIKIKNETLKEMQELDTNSIICETRSTRGKNVKKSQIETKVESNVSYTHDQKAAETYKRIKAVADSDSE